MFTQPLAPHNRFSPMRGFTLIELVVGITLVAIVATLLARLIVPAVRQSAEPLVQQRAASLAQALMDEILSKRYDENTPEGGMPPCTIAPPSTATSCSTILGPEGEGRTTFDDVDDYNSYCAGSVVIDANNNTLDNYASFRMSICVSYDTTYTGGVTQSAKRIVVTITPLSNATVPIVFTAYRMNF